MIVKALWTKLTFFVLIGASVALGQSGGGFDLSWNTIDGGGTTSMGGGFELSGTIGQPDAGVMSGGGGSLTLTGGFWIQTPPGDCDGDGDVDLADFQAFEDCLVGPDGSVGGECQCYDLDRDGTVDLGDFSTFAAEYTGP